MHRGYFWSECIFLTSLFHSSCQDLVQCCDAALLISGKRTKDRSWPESWENEQVILSACFICCWYIYISIYTGEVLFFFFAWKFSSSGRSHVGWLFTKKEHKKMTRDVFHTLATGAGLVYDCINPDFWTSVFNKQNKNPSEKLLCVCMYYLKNQ